MASEHVLLIMRINIVKLNMDDIMREKLNISPTLNFNERLFRQSLNKKLGTRINQSLILNALKR